MDNKWNVEKAGFIYVYIEKCKSADFNPLIVWELVNNTTADIDGCFKFQKYWFTKEDLFRFVT
jgi:hypothetical protein